MHSMDDSVVGAPVAPQGARLEQGLRAAGWDEPSIATWLSAFPDPDHSPEQHLLHVLSWGRCFPDATTAREWYDSALELEDAAAWFRADFSLSETEGIQARVIMAALTPDVTTIVQAEDSWRTSGLPAAWITACLDAGITEVARARRILDLRTSL